MFRFITYLPLFFCHLKSPSWDHFLVSSISYEISLSWFFASAKIVSVFLRSFYLILKDLIIILSLNIEYNSSSFYIFLLLKQSAVNCLSLESNLCFCIQILSTSAELSLWILWCVSMCVFKSFSHKYFGGILEYGD